MAYDFFFRKKTPRDWSLPPRVSFSQTPPPVAESPNEVAEVVQKAVSADRSLAIRPRGRGAVVTKKFSW